MFDNISLKELKVFIFSLSENLFSPKNESLGIQMNLLVKINK